MMRGQQNADPARVAGDGGADLEQRDPDGGRRGMGQLGAGQSHLLEPLHQRIGQRREPCLLAAITSILQLTIGSVFGS